MSQLEFDFEKKENVRYYSVKFQIGWLPGALSFTEQAKTAMAADLGIDKKIIRGSYAILGAGRDPLIQEGQALKRMLTAIRNEYTIPEYTLISSALNKDDVKTEKVAGSYLIEACKIDEFLSRFNTAKAQYLSWGKRVAEQENYDRIRQADQDALGKDWAVIERKYPSANQIADSVTCDIPRIEPFNATFTLADVAPETARYLREQAEARMKASIDGATAELVLEFKTMVNAVAKSCGKRIRLLPPPDHAWADLRNAEVQHILTHQEAPEDIPEGKLLITVQRATTNEQNKLVQTGKPEEHLITKDEYNGLKPYESEEYKILTQSAFDNLLALAHKISTVKSMLGESTEVADLAKLAADVEDTLRSAGGSASEITKQLKNSPFARTTMRDTFQGFARQISEGGLEMRTQQQIRPTRKIKLRVENERTADGSGSMAE